MNLPMLEFLFKGLVRDRSRSKFPLLVVLVGVMLTVFFHAWMGGFKNDMIWSYASFKTGHLKITTAAYIAQEEQLPIDLALLGVDSLLQTLRRDFAGVIWTPRIRFAGLLDIPDSLGETRAQGPVMGLALDLLGAHTPEKRILNIDAALVRGRLPERPGEVLVSDQFARKLGVLPGETATLISNTMYNAMALHNFVITGTVHFGITAIDRSAMIADFRDIQLALDMQNGAGEILGYFTDFQYHEDRARRVRDSFQAGFSRPADQFAPTMRVLREQDGLSELLDLFDTATAIIIGIFLFVMFVILWNAGLMGNLRRYGEIGVRLAIGEDKSHVYSTLLAEAVMIGLAGTICGTALGVSSGYFLQFHGIDFGSMMRNSSMLISNVMRAHVTTTSYLIGFLPGLVATFLGAAVSGIGIYKRQTSQLFKELEV